MRPRTQTGARAQNRACLYASIAFNGGGHGRLVRVKGHARSHPTCTHTPVNARPWNGAVISDPGAVGSAACARRRRKENGRTMRRGCIVHLVGRDEGREGRGTTDAWEQKQIP